MNIPIVDPTAYTEYLIQAGDTEGFRNNQNHLPPMLFLHQLAKRMILEGIATPVRGECLTKMLRLVLNDRRLAKEVNALFFRTLKMDQEYSSFKAVTFWKLIKEITPGSAILEPANFLAFLLYANSELCSDDEQLIVGACVVELISSVDLRLITDLHLSINHPFFSFFYLRWEKPDDRALLGECLRNFNKFHAENLKLMLQNREFTIPSDYFSCILICQRFDLGIVLIEDPRVPISVPQDAFFIPPLSDDDLYIEEKLKDLNHLLADLVVNPRLPIEIADVYADALTDSASDLTDSSEETAEPPSKKARFD